MSLLSALVVVGLATVPAAQAIPPNTPHTDTEPTIQWEEDGTEDGSSSHNHRSDHSFRGFGDTGEPYSAYSVWDDRDYRIDLGDAVFSNGHGFIEETADDAAMNRIPRYRFSDASDPWPAEARARVREAFAAWGAIASDDARWRTEITFQESTGAGEITLLWEDMGAAGCGGAWTPGPRTQRFDSSLNWSFDADPSGIEADEWHFFSVALHEIGHIVGLFHQTDASDLMFPSVGVPTGGAAAGVPAGCLGGAPAGTFFMGIDPDSADGVRDLYSIPVGLDLAFTIDTTGSMFDDIAAVKAAASDIVQTLDDRLDDYRVAVVSYEDFPVSPYGTAACGDAPFHDVLPFSTDEAAVVAAIQSLTLRCGGDFPESVLSALMHTIDGSTLGNWRQEDQVDSIIKAIIVMGDAPPHDPEPFTGFTTPVVIQAAEDADPIIFFPISIGFDSSARAFFQEIADGSGGQLFEAATASDVVDAVIAAIGGILEPENRPPVCEFAVADPSHLWPPNHRLVPVSLLGVEDPDGDPVTLEITAITQDELVVGRGSGATAPDGTGVGTATAQLRAERAGPDNSRVYEVSFVATDNKGAECSGSVLVAVPHDQGANTSIVDDGQIFDSTTP